MSDQTTWKVHGPVRTLRVEHVEWDRGREEWLPARTFMLVQFRHDGKIQESECHNSDGSVARTHCVYDESGRLMERQFRMNAGDSSTTRYVYDSDGRPTHTLNVAADGNTRECEVFSYDAAGCKTKVQFLAPGTHGISASYMVEGSECGYSAPGAVTVTVIYDHHDQPSETAFHDAYHHLVKRIVFERDGEGRLLGEIQVAGERAFDFGPAVDSNPDQRTAAQAMLTRLFGPSHSTSTINYVYDPAGRLAERYIRLGDLGGARTTFTYGADGQEIAETIENHRREFRVDGEGNPQVVSEERSMQHLRFEYRYDEQGNWLDRVVWSRQEPNAEFERSNLQRREIAYYDASTA